MKHSDEALIETADYLTLYAGTKADEADEKPMRFAAGALRSVVEERLNCRVLVGVADRLVSLCMKAMQELPHSTESEALACAIGKCAGEYGMVRRDVDFHAPDAAD